jgi:hypothetical protein
LLQLFKLREKTINSTAAIQNIIQNIILAAAAATDDDYDADQRKKDQ